MNTLKNVVKKAIAVGTGAVMLGTTMSAAVWAQDLSAYPAPFIANGQFNGLIVVGERAAAQDIIGAIDIASSLQASSTTPVTGGSGSTRTTLTGDAVQIGDSGDMLEIGEQLGAVTETLTDADLEMLQAGSITTQKGTTSFTQTLELDVANAGSSVVKLAENNDDETGMFLFFDDGSPVFEYELEFTSGLESDWSGTDGDPADDLEDEAIFMLGQYYTVVNSIVDDDADDLTLELIAGDVSDTLTQGQTKTYTVNGEDYEVSVLVIGNSGADVKFLVNGEVTDSLGDGETDTLSDGLEIGVRDIIETTAYRESDPGSIVEFYLGANKIEITDGDVTNSALDADVEINRENIEDLQADISAVLTATDVRVNSITMRLLADSAEGTDIYLAAGEGLREMLDEPEGMLNADWDFVFQGLSEPETAPIEFRATGDDQYELMFSNRRGDEFSVPFLYAGSSVDNNGVFGDEDDSLILYEENETGAYAADMYVIDLDDYFVVSDTAGAVDDNDDTYVLQFTDVDEDDSVVSFEHMGTGSEITATFTGTLSTSAGSPVTGDLTIGGKDFSFWMYEPTAGDYRLAIDLDNSGVLGNSTVVDIVAQGGAILTIDSGVFDGDAVMTLLTQADDVDSDVAQSVNLTFTETNDEVDADWSNTANSGTWYTETITDEDRELAVNAYGTVFEKTDEDDESDSITVHYPLEQVEALVYVTGGEVSTQTTTTGGSGAARVNPIEVGSAVLDRDVRYDQTNMIVVGGPCANTMAAQLLGNPADCAEGFTEGHAMIQLFDTGRNMALLVAGYSAQDTVGASRVIAQYGDYSANLRGTSVDVAVESLTDISVSPAGSTTTTETDEE